MDRDRSIFLCKKSLPEPVKNSSRKPPLFLPYFMGHQQTTHTLRWKPCVCIFVWGYVFMCFLVLLGKPRKKTPSTLDRMLCSVVQHTHEGFPLQSETKKLLFQENTGPERPSPPTRLNLGVQNQLRGFTIKKHKKLRLFVVVATWNIKCKKFPPLMLTYIHFDGWMLSWRNDQ